MRRVHAAHMMFVLTTLVAAPAALAQDHADAAHPAQGGVMDFSLFQYIAAIGVFILPRAWRLGREALRVLVQAAPAGVDVAEIRRELAALPGIVDVHDLHVWTLTSEMEVASAHLMVRTGTDTHGVLDQARSLLQDRYGLDHATLQVEPEDHRGCDEVRW